MMFRAAGARMSVIMLGFVMMAVLAGQAFPADVADDLVQSVQRARGISRGEFSRINEHTVKFEGHIDRGSFADYQRVMDDKVDTIIVSSPGGDTYDGVRIGMDMAGRDLTVIVDGVAASSAANYMFTAGKRRIIRRGFVGFHGNAYAARDDKRSEQEIVESAKEAGMDAEMVAAALADLREKSIETQRLEREFLTGQGISQKLFDITQADGKGLDPELGLEFEFLLPSTKTMERFGIYGVEGRQDIELAEKLGLDVIYY